MRIIKKPKVKVQTCSCCTTVFKPHFKDIDRCGLAGSNKYVVCPVCGHWNVRSNEELFKGFKKEGFKDGDD